MGLGSVLGYLIAGAAIGPAVFGLTGHDGRSAKDVLDFAGFGVVVMLFLIGLELRPARLWEMRGSVLGLGGLQVVATAAGFLNQRAASAESRKASRTGAAGPGSFVNAANPC